MKKSYLKLLIFLTVIFTIMLSSQSVYAGEKVGVCIDGQVLEFKVNEQIPYVERGVTFVPLRQVFENLDCKVEYDVQNKTAIIKKGDEEVLIAANKSQMEVKEKNNCRVVNLVSPAKITSNGRFVLPLRAVSEALGIQIEWSQPYNCAFIFTKNISSEEQIGLIEKNKPLINEKLYSTENPLFMYYDKGYGYINREGKIVVNAENETEFQVGTGNLIAKYNEKGLYGYINANGQMVIEPQFIKANKFSNGVAIVLLPEDLREERSNTMSADGQTTSTYRSFKWRYGLHFMKM